MGCHMDLRTCSVKKLGVVEMQSEAGAAGSVHGSLQAGALTSNIYSFSGDFFL